MTKNIRVGITHGDINGISYEVIVKALADERIKELCTPVLFGSAKLIGYYRKVLGIEDVQFHQIENASAAREGYLNLVNVSPEEFKVDLGIPTQESGKAAILALDQACEALRNGEIDVLVTAPISKQAMQMAGFGFPGHTEYLQEKLGDGAKATMVLFNDDMRVALVSTHLPLRNVADAITKEAVEEKIRELDATLRRDFGYERPRIAVLSLNPHCGDDGVLGSEEKEIILPAIEACIEDKILAFGPYPADGFFGAGSHLKFDGIIAMYHDQGLAPFKTVAGTEGVNFTAGIPYVRTSPDHGTAYDIAGRNVADPASMRKAIYAACDLYKARRRFDRASANPLKKQYVERGSDKTVDLSKTEDL